MQPDTDNTSADKNLDVPLRDEIIWMTKSCMVKIPFEVLHFENIMSRGNKFYIIIDGMIHTHPAFDRMLLFHKSPTHEMVNHVIATEGDLYTLPNEEKIEELIDELYSTIEGVPRKVSEKYRKKHLEQIKAEKQTKVKYSNPFILAWVYSVVTTYPHFVPYIENSVYVDRAHKFMAGYYNTIMENAQAAPVVSVPYKSIGDMLLSNYDFNLVYDRSTGACDRWFVNSLRGLLMNVVQYGATGDRKYLTNCDKIESGRIVPLHILAEDIAASTDMPIAGDIPMLVNAYTPTSVKYRQKIADSILPYMRHGRMVTWSKYLSAYLCSQDLPIDKLIDDTEYTEHTEYPIHID